MKFKALGITFIVAVLAAIVAGVYFWQAGSLDFENWQLPNHKSTTANWKTYANSEYEFEFKYPNDFIIYVSGNLPGVIPPCDLENNVICSYYIGNRYKNTNFVSAGFYMTYNDRVSENLCGKQVSNSGIPEKVDVNGSTFLKTIDGGAAAGSSEKSIVYSIYKNDQCINLVSRIAQSNFENYDSTSGIVRFDDSELTMSLNKILSNFKFTDSSTPQTGKGILTGHANVGPNCPVERIDDPCKPSEAANTSRQVGIFTPEGKLVASQHFDANGNYTFSLSPGTYMVKASSMKVDLLSTVIGSVTIKSGQTTKLDFDIDTGIR